MNATIKTILALDTALMGCAAGLWDVETGRETRLTEPMARGQSERLVPMVQDVLVQAGKTFAAIDLIVVTAGPGAFTGLRLGLSAARAWGLALRRPVVGVDTLGVLAAMYFAQGHTGPVRVLIETKRNDFYTQLFGVDERAAGPMAALPFADIDAQNDPAGTVYIGDAAARFAALAGADIVIKDGFDMIDPVAAARYGLAQYRGERAAAGGMTAQNMPEPIYLRGADVSQSKRVQRVIEE